MTSPEQHRSPQPPEIDVDGLLDGFVATLRGQTQYWGIADIASAFQADYPDLRDAGRFARAVFRGGGMGEDEVRRATDGTISAYLSGRALQELERVVRSPRFHDEIAPVAALLDAGLHMPPAEVAAIIAALKGLISRGTEEGPLGTHARRHVTELIGSFGSLRDDLPDTVPAAESTEAAVGRKPARRRGVPVAATALAAVAATLAQASPVAAQTTPIVTVSTMPGGTKSPADISGVVGILDQLPLAPTEAAMPADRALTAPVDDGRILTSLDAVPTPEPVVGPRDGITAGNTGWPREAARESRPALEKRSVRSIVDDIGVTATISADGTTTLVEPVAPVLKAPEGGAISLSGDPGELQTILDVPGRITEKGELVVPSVSAENAPDAKRPESARDPEVEKLAQTLLLKETSWELRGTPFHDADHTVAYAYVFFLNKGFSDEQAAGIVGSLGVESGGVLDPAVKQHGGGKGRGIAQWSVDERWQDLLAFCKKKGLDPLVLDSQLDFIMEEMQHVVPWSETLEPLRQATTVAEASEVFERKYEKAGHPAMRVRTAFGQQVYDRYHHLIAVAAKQLAAQRETARQALPSGQKIVDRLQGKYDKISGNLDSSELERVGPQWGGLQLNPAAAEALRRMNEAFSAEFGHDMVITDAYRSFDAQVELKERKPVLAGKPGTSNHGWGLAIDAASNINVANSSTHKWMLKNAWRFGWTLPDWARPNGSKPEPWHWEFVGSSPLTGLEYHRS